MEEIESPTEKIQEEIHHCALLAGHHSNEAMIDQIHASDQWAFYQSKGLKANLLSSKMEMLAALGKPTTESDQTKLADYKREQEEIRKQAEEKESASRAHLKLHVIYARGVTLFQVAIGVAAIAVLTKRRRFWLVGMGFGAVGLFFLIQGLLS